MTEKEMKQRTKQFAPDVLQLISQLPRSPEAGIIANQLGRSGTSVGANYRAACRAKSKADFIARLGIVEEEADESCYWLELIRDGEMLPTGQIETILDESSEITAIIVASRKTAGGS